MGGGHPLLGKRCLGGGYTLCRDEDAQEDDASSSPKDYALYGDEDTQGGGHILLMPSVGMIIPRRTTCPPHWIRRRILGRRMCSPSEGSTP